MNITTFQPEHENKFECIGFICGNNVLTNAIYEWEYTDFGNYVIAQRCRELVDNRDVLVFDVIGKEKVIANFNVDVSEAYNTEDFFECIQFIKPFEPFPLTQYSKGKIRIDSGWFDYVGPAMEAEIDIMGNLTNISKAD